VKWITKPNSHGNGVLAMKLARCRAKNHEAHNKKCACILPKVDSIAVLPSISVFSLVSLIVGRNVCL
jgi:hypothetical protein